jgi:hypothetical protein
VNEATSLFLVPGLPERREASGKSPTVILIMRRKPPRLMVKTRRAEGLI